MHKLFSKYLSNATYAALCSDHSYLQKMIIVEVALAQAQAAAGIIPEAAAEQISTELPMVDFDMDELAADTAKNGIPTIGFLNQAKRAIPEEAANFLHWGVTSQDITDTAMILLLKEVSGKVKLELDQIIGAFSKLKTKHGSTQLASRTRNQMAVTMSFALKVDSWKNPLERLLTQLDRLEPEVFCLQLAGADGQLGILGEKAVQVRDAVGNHLKLTSVPGWHSQREGLTAFADLLARIAAALGKFGQDVLTLAQSEVGEVQEIAAGGGSSSMPHKNNPVGSEAMVSLAGVIIDFAAGIKRAQIHKNERDGIALATEWMLWPKCIEAMGAVLQHGLQVATHLEVHPEKMKSNIMGQSGMLDSEKATYLLAPYLGLTAAKKKVAAACELAHLENLHLAQALSQLTPELNINWKSALQ
ncbi:MAG: hypothetical protein RLZZ241_2141 [Bacteroidota bacterium]|jgi:3-carboxy-cis,cis-muconate cycloisomerase